MNPIMSFTRIFFALLGFTALASAETVGLYFDPATPQIAFAAGDIKAAEDIEIVRTWKPGRAPLSKGKK